MKNTYLELTLQDWLYFGQQTGRILELETVVLAYLMDEREAAAWVADIVMGRTSETDALVFMKRAVEFYDRYHQ
ncbi:MAG TPA: hypothetical protein VHO48_06285 [Anaerolineaceae bacterium]|nr:hypothetical protein [Anaerolineaceae bacterium]HEX3051523.1 hypothetical protein [Aggregatilineaceae bacterium]